MQNSNRTGNKRKLIVRTLMEGGHYRPRDIKDVLRQSYGLEVDTRYISNVLYSISNNGKSNLSYFVVKNRKGNSYTYSLVDEIKELPEEAVYGLTINSGAAAYSLEQAASDYPALKKYIYTIEEKDENELDKNNDNDNENENENDSEKDAKGFNREVQMDDKTNKGDDIITTTINKISDVMTSVVAPEKNEASKEQEQLGEKSLENKGSEDIISETITAIVPELDSDIPVFDEKIPSYDGTLIHYMSVGRGDITIAACNGIGVSTFFWKYIVRYFAAHCRIILWDYRSHGRSDPAPNYKDLSMDNTARDLKAVLDHNKIDKAMLIGHSMGAQVIFEFYRLFPQRVLGLIPLLGSYGSPLNTFLNTDKMAYVVHVMYYLSFFFPNTVNSVLKHLIYNPLSFGFAKITKLVNWQHCTKLELTPYLQHLSSLDQRVFFTMARYMHAHNARDILPSIDVPTLIIAGENDLFTPLYISEEMLMSIPQAELSVIPRGSHAAIIEQPDLINLRIEKFINEHFGGLKPLKYKLDAPMDM